ncbi:hypothetical protein INR49_024416 [Caranx melampygus]|nr:hypothetical protein INR49_024416 [Caranx melampygus]
MNPKVLELFSLDRNTGEIRVNGTIDYETADVFKLDVQASDKGQPPMTTDCRVLIKIQDVNDNKPEIEVTSISSMVPENSKYGTVISLISVTDVDSGLNGKVISSLVGNVPFELKPSFKENMYSLVIREALDRETVSHYDISITATDCGEPPLSAFKSLRIEVSDINDNIPEFSQSPLELYLMENNTPGASIFSVSAFDNDLNENAAVSYISSC